jgi:hypothetical protein
MPVNKNLFISPIMLLMYVLGFIAIDISIRVSGGMYQLPAGVFKERSLICIVLSVVVITFGIRQLLANELVTAGFTSISYCIIMPLYLMFIFYSSMFAVTYFSAQNPYCQTSYNPLYYPHYYPPNNVNVSRFHVLDSNGLSYTIILPRMVVDCQSTEVAGLLQHEIQFYGRSGQSGTIINGMRLTPPEKRINSPNFRIFRL